MKKASMMLAVISAFGFAAINASAGAPGKSPLLGDYSSFKKDKEDKSMLIYRNGDRRASDYKKFIIDPVLIYPSSHRGGAKFSSANLQELADYFRALLRDSLKDGYETTEIAGPETLRLRFGIRDLMPGRYYMDGTGSHQIKPDTKLAAVTFEMEGIDSVTGERIIALVRDVHNEEVKGADREEQVNQVSDVFADWVRILKSRMDQSKIPN